MLFERPDTSLSSAESLKMAAFLASQGNNPADWFDTIPGERMRVLAGSGQSSGAFTLVESVIAAGAAAPLHVHHKMEEVFFVTQGCMRFVCGGEAREAASGSVIHIPKTAHHGWVNASRDDVRMVALFAPGGMEDMFRALGQTPLEGIEALAARFDTFIVGPLVQA